jgi:hypothetical protein
MDAGQENERKVVISHSQAFRGPGRDFNSPAQAVAAVQHIDYSKLVRCRAHSLIYPAPQDGKWRGYDRFSALANAPLIFYFASMHERGPGRKFSH